MNILEMEPASNIRSLSDAELDQVSGGAEARYSEAYMDGCVVVLFGALGVMLREKGTLNSLNR